jgi:hypothetical protein
MTIQFIVDDPANGQQGTPFKCARHVCQTAVSRVWYWNYSTRDWYCETCARRINTAMDGEICKPQEKPD